jgi:hypothetical protein
MQPPIRPAVHVRSSATLVLRSGSSRHPVQTFGLGENLGLGVQPVLELVARFEVPPFGEIVSGDRDDLMQPLEVV